MPKKQPLLVTRYGYGDDEEEAFGLNPPSRTEPKQSCNMRLVGMTLLLVIMGVTVGGAATLGYYQWIHPSSPSPTPSPTPITWTDVNMKRFWFERNLPFQLYYNHSSLSNSTIFPRVTKVSWGGMNGAEVQLDLCHRIVWVIDQLLNVSRPTKYTMAWQFERVGYLHQLRDIYVNKTAQITDAILNGRSIMGMIPKWYYTGYPSPFWDDDAFDQGAFVPTIAADRSPSNYSWWSSTPRTALAAGNHVVMGTEFELDLMNAADRHDINKSVVWSRHAMHHLDIGRSDLATEPGVSMVDCDGVTARIVSIMAFPATQSAYTKMITRSTKIPSAAKPVMISRLLDPYVAVVESAVVRLARAYSPDRGNLIVEGGMAVLWDSPASPQSSSSLPYGGTARFPINKDRIQPCLRIAHTGSSLAMLVSSLRDRDILSVSYGTDTINATNDWYPHFITEFERTSQPYRGAPSRSRQLLVRSLATINPTDGSVNINIDQTQSDASSIAPINLFGWNDWIVHSNVSYAQVWGRAKSGSITEPIDATVEVANGNIITSDVNGMITEYGTRCNWLLKRYDWCSSYDGSAPDPWPPHKHAYMINE